MNLNLKINENEINKSFERIANDLFNNYVLIVQGEEYRLTEIEFYYYNKKSHPDNCAHRNELQKASGKWYFHGSGLDITFGDKNSYGGILLRGFMKIGAKSNIDGPLNLVQEIFRNFGLVQSSKKFEFTMKKKVLEEEDVIKAPRIGLNKDTCPKYFSKKYRYLIMPKLKHKDKLAIAEANELDVKEIYA